MTNAPPNTLETVAIKRIHVIDGICFMVFDKSVVQELQLNTGEIWVEQHIIPGGIGLNVKRRLPA